MSPKERYYFAGNCLSLNDHPEFCDSISQKFTSGEISPDAFISFCDQHLILPAVYLQLKKHNLLHHFPDDYKAHLAALFLRNKKRNFDILRQVEEINHALEKHNIEPVYLKGTAHLLDNLFSDSGERIIGDIDVLVQEKNYLNAAEVIMQLGYRYDKKFTGDVMRRKHFPRLFRNDVPNDIELHRLPVEERFSKKYNSTIIFSHRKEIEGKTNCFVPCREYQAIHNFIHSQLGNLGYRFKATPLRDLYDIHLLTKETDQAQIIKQAEEKTKISHYLQLAGHIFQNQNLLQDPPDLLFSRYIHSMDRLLDHPKKHQRHILWVKITDLIFCRILPSAGKIFTKICIQNTFKNLFDPAFYKMLNFRIRNFYRNYLSR